MSIKRWIWVFLGYRVLPVTADDLGRCLREWDEKVRAGMRQELAETREQIMLFTAMQSKNERRGSLAAIILRGGMDIKEALRLADDLIRELDK